MVIVRLTELRGFDRERILINQVGSDRCRRLDPWPLGTLHLVGEYDIGKNSDYPKPCKIVSLGETAVRLECSGKAC